MLQPCFCRDDPAVDVGACTFARSLSNALIVSVVVIPIEVLSQMFLQTRASPDLYLFQSAAHMPLSDSSSAADQFRDGDLGDNDCCAYVPV